MGMVQPSQPTLSYCVSRMLSDCCKGIYYLKNLILHATINNISINEKEGEKEAKKMYLTETFINEIAAKTIYWIGNLCLCIGIHSNINLYAIGI